jgi:pyruvate kinase
MFDYNKKEILELLEEVELLISSARKLEQQNSFLLKQIHSNNIESARNLLHYLAIRATDFRRLQKALSNLAISSISHSESYTLNNLLKIKKLLSTLVGITDIKLETDSLSLKDSFGILKDNSRSLFGKTAFDGQTKIMVTLPTEAGINYSLVYSLVHSGMHVARINTAHDSKDVWKKMIANIKKASKATGKKVKIYMDLEGPKIRTGNIISSQNKKSSDKVINPSILLFKGSKLILTKSQKLGNAGKQQQTIPITLPEVFGHVKTKEHVWFDDGKLGGVIVSVSKTEIEVEITQAPEDGFKLKAEKGINFPDSELKVSALTVEDLLHLKFIAKHADMVGFSFVQRPEDITTLQHHLTEHGRKDIGIILKIEIKLAFENFPILLFTAMKFKNCGVMIARGDLAVEIGYNRIAEVQEEILWLSEAAHMPVIWATQVLETQVKKGLATRAEISDVVKAVRAECVMLNKGTFVTKAIETIKDIDKRMAAHEDKKRKINRSLDVAKIFLDLSK